MRDKSSLPTASWAGKLAKSLLLATSLVSLPGAHSISVTPIPLPNLSLNDLGRVAFVGDFNAISLYQYAGQSESTAGPHTNLLSQLPNSVFATLDRTDADIRALCPFSANGTFQGIVVGGNFTNLGTIQTPGGLAIVNGTDGRVSPLVGLNGTVNALLCDDRAGSVYVGGSFSGRGSNNAIVWTSDWRNLPFAGFNGPVNAITKTANGNIIFGGKFNGLGNSSTPRENNTQVLPLSAGNIQAQTSSGRQGLSDPKNVICKTGESEGPDNTWLLADNAPGFWQADFGFGFQPSKLRLYNTNFEGRGTKTWRYTALPDGGIMNFSYVDPTSGTEKYCEARCPLPQGNLTAQDFKFVNNVGMNSFRIDISDWYGPGAGLNGIALFQNDIYTFAINSFNEPQCNGATTGARSTQTGPWAVTPSGKSNSQYLTATLTDTDIRPESAQVVFQPDIRQSGNYSISVYTPGCADDNTCGNRFRVKITGTLTSRTQSSDAPLSTELFQTNNYDKYDTVYSGFVDASGDFRPSVTIAPVAGQEGPRPLKVVAQRVRFTLLEASSGNLNGLFEYNPTDTVVPANFDKSKIIVTGQSLSPKNNAVISSLAVVDSTTYVAGNFTGNNGLNNILLVGDSNATALSGDGLNNQVETIYQNGSTLYVGGSFTNTNDNKATGLNGVASYSTTDKRWQPLGAGVNGEVTDIVPLSLNLTANGPEDVLAISGYFDRVNGFGGNASFPVENFAVWVPSRRNWLQNLNITTVALQGTLRARVNVPNQPPVYAGSLSSQQLGADGAAIINGAATALQPFPMNIRPQSAPRVQKRAVAGGANTTGIVTAVFYQDNGLNLTILGGHFAATATDGSNITNLMIIDGKKSDTVTGLHDELSSDSVFTALGPIDTLLFAGGRVSGNIKNSRVAGVIAYDLVGGKYADTQPPPLQGQNVTVSTIVARPKSKEVYVGGNFVSAGALSCAALCVWQTDINQWASVGDLSGTVTSLTWISNNKLVVAGNLTQGGNHTNLILFDAEKRQFGEVAGAHDLPGPVTSVCPANNDGKELWVVGTASSNGAPYLQRFDGTKWRAAPTDQFSTGTTIRGIQVLPLAGGRGHGKSDLIDQEQDLLLLGSLNLTNFGTASGVLFNGTAYQPLLLSTTSDNTSGSLSQVFVEKQSFFKNKRKPMAIGFVVLISMAIALVATFLLVVFGILLEWYRRKRQGYTPAPMASRTANLNRLPPEHLFSTLSGNRAPAI